MTFGVCVLVAGVAACQHSLTAPSPAPTISGISPTLGHIGDTITVTGTGFTPTGNAIQLGSGYVLGVPSTEGKTLRLVLPAYLGACPPSAGACAALALQVSPGTYQLSVVNEHGTSNSVPFTNIQT